MRWLLLLLVLVTDPPASGEETGAKAMFKDPSLHVLSFSPHQGKAEPFKEPSGKPVKEVTQKEAVKGAGKGEAKNGIPKEAKKPGGKEKVQNPPSPPSPPSPMSLNATGGLPEEPASVGKPPRSVGIRFWVQRVDDRGKVLGDMEVGHIFRSGERIQLVVESNTEGYLAVVQQGSDGRAGLLFPPHEGEVGMRRIPAHVKVVLPDARYSFTFDQEAGTERLLIVLARDRQELAELPLRREMGPEDLAAVRRLAARELGAKNLVIQSFDEPEDRATYTVNRAGNAIVQEIALVHEK
ncbi:MAG TPA: DUF4384 domain-containing protein [Thermoanaerobaculia bacterium]|nr:DUF4384 domain-containing protein [Thermoanaerobaculia bacterium]